MNLIPAKIRMYNFHRGYLPKQAELIYLPDPTVDYQVFLDYLVDEVFTGRSATYRNELDKTLILPWQCKYLNKFWHIEFSMPSGEFMSEHLREYQERYVDTVQDMETFLDNMEEIAKVITGNLVAS